MTLKNDARNAAGPCELREVAFELLHWPPNIGKWSFKDDYMLGDIAALRGIFSARRKSESTSSSCTSEPRRFLKADGVVRYMSGTIALRTDYISIVLYNPTNLDFDLNPNNEILWTNGCTQNSSTCSVNLHGNKLGHPTLTGSWQTWNINFKSYFSQYFPSPPGGQSVDDAHVVAFEVYTSVRGSDLDVELKDLDVQD